VESFKRHGLPDAILPDYGRVFTGKLAKKPATVLFDRICHNNGVRHILTAPYSPTTTGKIERLHRTMRKEFFDVNVFDTIEEAQAALDLWVAHYNTEREHQSIGDVAPIRRFELAALPSFDVIEGDVSIPDPPAPPRRSITRMVDSGGRVRVLAFRYHVGRHLKGQRVEVTNEDGLLHFSHNGALVATHARRHLAEDDAKFEGRPRALRPSRPTNGNEVIRTVDMSGAVSFAGIGYRAGNKLIGRLVGVRVVGDIVQITLDGQLVRTHQARHDRAKEYGAFAQPHGKSKRSRDGVA
jgi:hypothetical protein